MASKSFPALLLALLATLAFPLAPGASNPGSSPAPKPANKPSPFGINAHLPSTQDFVWMEKAGIAWARIDLTWDKLEPRKGDYQWAEVDRVVADAEAHHVNLLAILGYCPIWAARGSNIYDPPRNISEWQAFVTAVVSRYKGRIRYWTLWNEPNSRSFFHGTLNQFLYEVFIPGAHAAKAADPDCKIVGPDLAHLGKSHWDDWLNAILKHAGRFIDVVSHHCYRSTPDEVFKQLDGRRRWRKKSVLQIIQRRGAAAKPFWLTEVGWRSTKVGEARQAEYVVSLLQDMRRRPWIRKVFFFELKDSPSLPGYGFRRPDGTPKEAFVAYKGFIAQSASQENKRSQDLRSRLPTGSLPRCILGRGRAAQPAGPPV